MIALTVLTWVASISVVATYAWMVVNRKRAVFFDAANAFGMFPIIATDIVLGAWSLLPLGVSFGLVGWYGLYRDFTAIDLSGPWTVDAPLEDA